MEVQKRSWKVQKRPARRGPTTDTTALPIITQDASN
jgi:hypothetical protein